MRLTDPVADMLTRIRNAVMVRHESVLIPSSKFKKGILEVLKREGYIASYEEVSENEKPNLKVVLKYTSDGHSVIRNLRRMSRPGRRLYVGSKNFRPVRYGLGSGIVSTSQGIKTMSECIKANIGGEYICQVW